MDAFLTCCGCRRKREQDVEQGLLAEYGEDTALQHRVHAKMHTYQMLHALADGYLPSNEQLVANLRTLLAADLLSPDEQDLSDDGRKLAGACKQGLRDFMRLLQSKNGEDQLQDFVWCLSHADISVNTKDVSRRASNMRAKADATAGQPADSSCWLAYKLTSSSLRERADNRQPTACEFRVSHLPG